MAAPTKDDSRTGGHSKVVQNDEPQTRDQWVSYVENKIKEATNWIERRQMLVNLNYYVGNQWIVWDNNQRQVVTAPNPNNQERITHNVLAARVMAKLAKQTKNRIKFDVRPDTNSQERIETAKAATKYVRVWWDEQELDLLTRDIHLNDNVKGWCALKIVFDNTKGVDITPDGEESKIYTGEITAQLIDPLTLYLDPAATTEDGLRWAVEETPKDIDYIFAKYGVKVSPDQNINYMSAYDVTQTASSGLTTQSQTRKTTNMAMVREMWIAPCNEHPKGLKITCTTGVLLDYDDAAGEIPYTLFGDIPVPNTVKYRSFLQDMIPIQRTINIAKTMMATHMKRMGNSMWAIPMGSDVDEEMLTNDEGGMFYFNAMNGSPQRIPPNDIPSFFDRILEYMIRDLDDMSGVREITGNALPAGLDTASGLSLMVEQENEKLAVTAQGYERGMKKVLNRVLRLMKMHYTEERQAKILGPDNEIELVSFRGSDLSGEEDINIVSGSSLPEMRSAQEDRIMTLWNAGAIVNDSGQPDSNKLLKLMGMGDSKHLYEMDMLDENKAKMENKQFKDMGENQQLYVAAQRINGQREQIMQTNQQIQMEAQNGGIHPNAVGAMMQQVPPPPEFIPFVRDFQNHEIHVFNHNLFRKSSEYERLPFEVQQMVDSHIADHERILQERAQSISPPPDIAVKQEANQIKREQVQNDAKNDAEKNQIEIMKVQAGQQQAVAKMAHESRMSEQNHNSAFQQTILNSRLKGGDNNG
ncbi:hypothetical protein [Paenibacillus sp. NEAU-GSW1]|uniref:portal protein n=1 Tax=Paenibacillus sp. NEAU-GSW1 TaxID=2682486 RepID=UPI0020A66933|nr:hypothetical protein [Paenibacillus sp. NEAU-GSW1]